MRAFLPGLGALDIPIASPTPVGDSGTVSPVGDGKAKPVVVLSRTNLSPDVAKALPSAEAASEVIAARREVAAAATEQANVIRNEKAKKVLTILGVGAAAWLLLGKR